MSDQSLVARLAEIQSRLNAPKNQVNKFGGYNYRSCEDILQAVKPLLGGAVITVTDDIVLVADRVYVKATATISDGKDSISTTAFAREALSKKGQDEAQTTGSASSYARKYALNGLLLIDDNKDADSQDNTDQQTRQQPRKQQSQAQPKPFDAGAAIKAISAATDRDMVNKYVSAARQRGATDQQMESINDAAMSRISQMEAA